MGINKQTIFTAGGIVLSFIIAFGGWMLTSILIDMRSDALFSAAEIIWINVPEERVLLFSDVYDSDAPNDRLVLSEREIVSVLNNWSSRGRERPHEPMAGQINMEQAITLGIAGLSSYAEQGVLPAEFFTFNTINANLRQNMQDGHQFLEPVYSYWTVVFTGEYMSATLIMNAATGQIWNIDITLRSFLYELHTDYLYDALDIFVSNIGLTGDEPAFVFFSYRGDVTALKSFADGEIFASANAQGRPLYDGTLLLMRLNISLMPLFPQSVIINEDWSGYSIPRFNPLPPTN